MTGLYNKCMSNLLRNCQTVLWSGFTIWHWQKQCMRVLLPLQSCQHLVCISFLIAFLIFVSLIWIMLSIFALAFWNLYLLWWIMCSNLLPAFSFGLYVFFKMSGINYIFYIKVFYQLHYCKYYLPHCGFSFLFLNSVI